MRSGEEMIFEGVDMRCCDGSWSVETGSLGGCIWGGWPTMLLKLVAFAFVRELLIIESGAPFGHMALNVCTIATTNSFCCSESSACHLYGLVRVIIKLLS